jgi:hypothetical protein
MIEPLNRSRSNWKSTSFASGSYVNIWSDACFRRYVAEVMEANKIAEVLRLTRTCRELQTYIIPGIISMERPWSLMTNEVMNPW